MDMPTDFPRDAVNVAAACITVAIVLATFTPPEMTADTLFVMERTTPTPATAAASTALSTALLRLVDVDDTALIVTFMTSVSRCAMADVAVATEAVNPTKSVLSAVADVATSTPKAFAVAVDREVVITELASIARPIALPVLAADATADTAA